MAEQVEAVEQLLRVEEGWGGLEVPVVPEEGKWFGGAWTRKSLMGGGGRGFWEKNAKGVKGNGKDCWNSCDYPSECRWGKQFGVQTPKTTTTAPAAVVPSTLVEEPKVEESSSKPKTSFDDILLAIADPSSPDYLAPLTTTKNSTTSSTTTTPLENDTSAPSMDDLLQSAKRWKRRSSGMIPLVPSPLGANPPSPEKKEKPVLRKSARSSALEVFEGDVKKGHGFEGLGELREKADAFVKSFHAAKVKLQTGTM